MSSSFKIFECPLLVTGVNFSEVLPSWTSLVLYKATDLSFLSNYVQCLIQDGVLKPGYSPTVSWLLSSSKNLPKASLVTESAFFLNTTVNHKPVITSLMKHKTCQVQVNHLKLLSLTNPLNIQRYHKE